jgi:hypothetical protein
VSTSPEGPNGSPTPETAYYYPEWRWSAEDYGWVKSLLLFFDEISLLVPEYMGDLPAEMDPGLAGALRDRGMLRVIRPETFVDDDMSSDLVLAMTALVESGAFDDVPHAESFPELSASRAGYFGKRGDARRVIAMLEEQGLAHASEDGVSIPMHPVVRSTYLVLLAQLARKAGQKNGWDLYPATNQVDARAVLDQTLELPPMPTRGRVTNFDLETVGVDLEAVSLDEVLDFRGQHLAEHRQYMENLRRFSREVSSIDSEAERQRAYLDRQGALEDSAQQLTHRARKFFKRPKNSIGFGLGFIGASILTHGVLPIAVALGPPLLSLIPDKSDSVYSYLFSAKKDL